MPESTAIFMDFGGVNNSIDKRMLLLSQHIDVTEESAKRVSCGVCALLMLMHFLESKNSIKKIIFPTPDQMHETGRRLGMYTPGVGWQHKGIVDMAKKYGFKKSHTSDLSKENDKVALDELKKNLKHAPVIASIYFRYQHGTGGHLLVLESLNGKKAKVWDSDVFLRDKVVQEVPANTFLKAWKKRFIIIG